jgi:hypothetical protein
MGAQYQVIAECAHVTLDGPSGRFNTLLLKGALVPGDAPEVERLVRDGYRGEGGRGRDRRRRRLGCPRWRVHR